MSDDMPAGPSIRASTEPRQRRTTRGRESLPEPSLAESLAADAVLALGETVPATGKLWAASTWDRVLNAFVDAFRERLRCQPRPPA